MTATAKLTDSSRLIADEPLLDNSEKFPDCATAFYADLRDQDEEATAAGNAGSLEFNIAREELGRAQSALGTYYRQCEENKVAPDPKNIATFDRAITRAKTKVAKVEKARQLINESRLPIDIVRARLRRLPAARYTECPVVVAKEKGLTREDQLAAKRAAEIALKEKLDSIGKQPLTVEEAKAVVRQWANQLAASGATNLRPAFHLIQQDLDSNRLTQGKPRPPTTPLSLDKNILNGAAMLFNLFRDEILAKLESQLDAMAQPDRALSARERKERIAEINEEILQNHREQCALVRAINASGGKAYHLKHMSVLALLGIEPDSGI